MKARMILSGLFGPDYIVMIKVKNPLLAQTTSDDKTKVSKTNDSNVEKSAVGPDKLGSENKNPSAPQVTTSKLNDIKKKNPEVALNDSKNKIKHSSQPRSSTKPAEKVHPILGTIEKAIEK